LMASKSAMLFPRSNGLERYKLPPHLDVSVSIQDLRPCAAAFGFRSSAPLPLAVRANYVGTVISSCLLPEAQLAGSTQKERESGGRWLTTSARRLNR